MGKFFVHIRKSSVWYVLMEILCQELLLKGHGDFKLNV